MADIYLHFPTAPAGLIRGDIEDALEGLMGDRGEIVGGGFGVGKPGFNIDLELRTDDEQEVAVFLASLTDYLKGLPAPAGTHVVILVGEQEAKHVYF